MYSVEMLVMLLIISFLVIGAIALAMWVATLTARVARIRKGERVCYFFVALQNLLMGICCVIGGYLAGEPGERSVEFLNVLDQAFALCLCSYLIFWMIIVGWLVYCLACRAHWPQRVWILLLANLLPVVLTLITIVGIECRS